jgi:uncharacterized protein YpmB
VLFLELFGLIFLLIKLTIVPPVKLVQRRFFSNNNRPMESVKEEVQLVQINQISADQVSQKDQVMNNDSRSDSEISVRTSS